MNFNNLRQGYGRLRSFISDWFSSVLSRFGFRKCLNDVPHIMAICYGWLSVAFRVLRRPLSSIIIYRRFCVMYCAARFAEKPGHRVGHLLVSFCLERSHDSWQSHEPGLCTAMSWIRLTCRCCAETVEWYVFYPKASGDQITQLGGSTNHSKDNIWQAVIVASK